ncbi:MAG: class I SAM-dependent methyltransferase [Roseiflexaceae bacterium]|jgi:SAM-dependent methyltransferase
MSNGFAWRPGEHDWVQIWREMYESERNQGESATHPDMHRSADQYATAAARYARNVKRVPQPDAFMRWLIPQVSVGSTVLDIGAGSGRYVAPLAQAGMHVKALEQSPAMREQIGVVVNEHQLTSVEVIAESWPTTQPIACDVAMAAHVLYAVRDIAPFVQAMHESARSMCVILLGVRHPTTPVLPLWHAYYGYERLPLPGALECVGALAQLGIAANVHILPSPAPISYASLDEAATEMCYRLRLPYGAPYQQQLADLIARDWMIDADGSVTSPHIPPPHAAIWWRTDV